MTWVTYNCKQWGKTKLTTPYPGDSFTLGDVIGVMLNMDDRTLTFFKNGKKLGVAFRDLPKVPL